jgi:MFS family permease
MEKRSGSGSGAAYAQSYGLFNCAMAGGTLAGPVLAGWLKEQFGWRVMTWALGAFSVSGAVMAVCGASAPSELTQNTDFVHSTFTRAKAVMKK